CRKLRADPAAGGTFRDEGARCARKPGMIVQATPQPAVTAVRSARAGRGKPSARRKRPRSGISRLLAGRELARCSGQRAAGADATRAPLADLRDAGLPTFERPPFA